MIRSPRLSLIALVSTLAFWVGAAAAQDWFSDDFNSGVLDPLHWRWGGAITESNGVLNLLRQSPADSIATVSSYGGDYQVLLDSRLDYIVWNDMFHGIALMNSHGAGISFGYSQYGKLYLAVSDGIVTAYYYGPNGSNQPGTWQHWALTKAGSQITIQVNGSTVFGPIGPVPDGVRVLMPGIYQDGDGPPEIGYTSSTVDNFSIGPGTSAVEGPAQRLTLSTWGKVKQIMAGAQ